MQVKLPFILMLTLWLPLRSPAAQTTAAADQNILEEVHTEVFVHLRNAQNYLRALANCFRDEPVVQAGAREAMYTEFTSCNDIRQHFRTELPARLRAMRVALALTDPALHEDPLFVEKNPNFNTRFNSSPKHIFEGLPAIAPLTAEEIQDASDRWETATRGLQEKYDQRSYMDVVTGKHAKLSDQEMDMYEAINEERRIKYVAGGRVSYRAAWLKDYHNAISAMPIVAFLKRPLKGDDGAEDRADIREGLYKLLNNNCLVRNTKFNPAAGNRAQAQSICKAFVSQLRAASDLPLDQQDKMVLEFEKQLDRRKSLNTVWRPTQLSVFGTHPALLDGYRNRLAKFPDELAAFDRMKHDYEQLELQQVVGEIGFYVGLGFACTFGLRRLPFAAHVIRRLGMPICLFATGLPINTAQWILGEHEYWERFTETFASAPYREMLQELKTLDNAQFAQGLNTIFMAVGTGLPEVYRAAKPWLRLRKLKAIKGN